MTGRPRRRIQRSLRFDGFNSGDGLLQGCNQAFARQLLGIPPERAIGKPFDVLCRRLPPSLSLAMAAGETASSPSDGATETTVACADGQERDFLLETAVMRAENGDALGMVGVLLDLTARNRAAREQMAREKLQGALETAGAVCHELNQPLQAITGYTELLAAGIDPGHPEYPWIGKLAEEARRIAAITRKLQNITRYETRP